MSMRRKNLGAGVLAGVIGGLVGSVVLKAAIVGARKLREGKTTTGTPPADFDSRGPAHQVGELAFHKMTGRSLTPQQRIVAGEIVHYAFGAATGAIYGGVAEYYEWSTWGEGLLFGTAVFVAADESSMPALGFVPWPWQESAPAQLEKLAVHLACGLGTEWGRKLARKLL